MPLIICGRFGRLFPCLFVKPATGWLPDDSDARFEVGLEIICQWRSVTDDPDDVFVYAYRKILNLFSNI